MLSGEGGRRRVGSDTLAPPLNDVVKTLKPRYHFASVTQKFWEREPFAWEKDGKDNDSRVTRFISLGAFGSRDISGSKQRVGLLLKTTVQTYCDGASGSMPSISEGPLKVSGQKI